MQRTSFFLNSKHLPTQTSKIGSNVSFRTHNSTSKVWITRIIPTSFTSLFPSPTRSTSTCNTSLNTDHCSLSTRTIHSEWNQQTKMCSTDLEDSNKSKSSRSSGVIDIEDLHKEAVMAKENTYIDPATGFMVFTELAHLKRGKCCGNVCRHCPYGWEGVSQRSSTGGKIRKTPKVRSGNRDAVQKLLQKIDDGEYFRDNNSDDDDDTDDGVSIPEMRTEIMDVRRSNNTSAEKVEIKKGNQPRPSKSGGRYGGTKTDKNVPYTRTGDAGTSVLLTGERRSKDDVAFEAMGTVDELCSVVGTVHAELSNSSRLGQNYGDLEEWLLDVMSRLFDIGSHVAKPRAQKNDDDDDDDDDDDLARVFIADGVGNGFDIEHVHILEELIDIMTDTLPELTSFILPTGSRAAAQLHVARCVCRRAERKVLPLVRDGVCDPNATRYLNRLSDFFFTAARFVNLCDGHHNEITYRRFTRGARQRDRVTVDLREEKKEL